MPSFASRRTSRFMFEVRRTCERTSSTATKSCRRSARTSRTIGVPVDCRVARFGAFAHRSTIWPGTSASSPTGRRLLVQRCRVAGFATRSGTVAPRTRRLAGSPWREYQEILVPVGWRLIDVADAKRRCVDSRGVRVGEAQNLGPRTRARRAPSSGSAGSSQQNPSQPSRHVRIYSSSEDEPVASLLDALKEDLPVCRFVRRRLSLVSHGTEIDTPNPTLVDPEISSQMSSSSLDSDVEGAVSALGSEVDEGPG